MSQLRKSELSFLYLVGLDYANPAFCLWLGNKVEDGPESWTRIGAARNELAARWDAGAGATGEDLAYYAQH